MPAQPGKHSSDGGGEICSGELGTSLFLLLSSFCINHSPQIAPTLKTVSDLDAIVYKVDHFFPLSSALLFFSPGDLILAGHQKLEEQLFEDL